MGLFSKKKKKQSKPAIASLQEALKSGGHLEEVRQTLVGPETSFFRKAVKKLSRKGSKAAVEVQLQRWSDKYGCYTPPYRVRWKNKKPIIEGLLLLNKAGEVTALEVIKFDVLGILKGETREKLEELIQTGYYNVGLKEASRKGLKLDLKKGSEFKNRKKLIKLGKKVVYPSWYKKVSFRWMKKKKS